MLGKLLLFIMIITFSSCNASFVAYYEQTFPIETNEWSYIWQDVSQNTYTKDTFDQWQSPSETAQRGTGDCEDTAILMMYKMHHDLGYEPTFVVIKSGRTNHAVVEWQNTWIEPQTYGLYRTVDESIVVYRLSYWQVVILNVVI